MSRCHVGGKLCHAVSRAHGVDQIHKARIDRMSSESCVCKYHVAASTRSVSLYINVLENTRQVTKVKVESKVIQDANEIFMHPCMCI
jgi:hypothetical protein